MSILKARDDVINLGCELKEGQFVLVELVAFELVVVVFEFGEVVGREYLVL